MKDLKMTIVGAIAIIALIVSMVGFGGNDQSSPLGGSRFPSGISADSTSPSSGQVRGTTFTSTGAATLASASVTGTLGVTGQLTSSGVFSVASSTPASNYGVVMETATTTIASTAATSTILYLQSYTSGAGGQVILEDSDGAGCSAISILDGTISSYTLTCPTD